MCLILVYSSRMLCFLLLYVCFIMFEAHVCVFIVQWVICARAVDAGDSSGRPFGASRPLGGIGAAATGAAGEAWGAVRRPAWVCSLRNKYSTWVFGMCVGSGVLILSLTNGSDH